MSNLLCSNDDLVETINQRLLDRLGQLGISETLIEPRSQQTRYTLPLQDSIPVPNCKPVEIRLNRTSELPDNNFIPRGSWALYSQNINTESILKRQHIALQKFPQSEYIPNSTSDLYNSPLDLEISKTFQGAHADAIFPNIQNGDIVSWYHRDPKCSHKGGKMWNNQSRTIY
jgi:hypothetical protein